MTFQTHKWRISRRHVLRGFGVSLSLPMLECMAASKSDAPKRSVFIYLPNGVNTLDYQILQSGKGYQFSKCLKPLEKYRDVVTPISGLHHPRSIGFHHGCQPVWLTGAQAGPTARNSISADQLMAQVTAPLTRFPSLVLSNTGRSLSYNADGISIPAETKPAQIFKRLFSAPEGGIDKERRELQRTGSVLDVVLGEAKQLHRQIGSEDRTRLDQFLDSVREVEIRTERADAWLDVPRPELTPAQKKLVDKDVSQQQVGEYFRAMYDLIVLAFETDLTRVATFSSGDEGKGLAIPEININQTRHSLSHHNGDPEQLRRLTESDIFNYQQFAYLIDRLQSTKDFAGKPLLDTTMCLYGSGMAYGHSHGNANVPTVLAGGSALGLKHGRHIDFNQGHFDGYNLADAKVHYQLCSRPVNPDARLSNLLLTMAQKMGVETEKFSDSLKTIGELES
jgi:hypothetical protein